MAATGRARETVFRLHYAARRFLLVAGILTAALSSAGAQSLVPYVISVDKVWTGTNSHFGSLTVGNKAIIAYYNSRRELTIAQLDLSTGEVSRSNLGRKTGGWDSHDETKVALDESNAIHAIFVKHSAPPEYFRGRSELSISDMSRVDMTRSNEDRLTYPSFLRADGRLFVVFRNGVSGNGEWFADELVHGLWRQSSKLPQFSGKAGNVPVSAYPSDFVKGPDGYFHVAIVWRKTPDVNSNFRITYAKTKDFSQWFNSSGNSIGSPVDASNSELIDDVGEGGGLVNNARINLTTSGTPLVAYTKYNDAGRNAVFLAFVHEGKWERIEIAVARQRVDIRGRGSLSWLPEFTPPSVEEDGSMRVKFAGDPSAIVRFNAKSLGIGRTLSNDVPKFDFPTIVSNGLSAPVTQSSIAERYDPKMYDVVFRWAEQDANSDLPRSCTSAAPQACDPPPSELLAYVFKR